MKRVRADHGMTLIELLIAMTVMAIGISALLAGFSSGILAINRSAKASTAGALADQQMEAYRRLDFSSIATDTTATATAIAGAESTYIGDPARPAGMAPSQTAPIVAPCPGSVSVPAYYYCNPSRPTSAPNGGTYRVDSYIGWACVIGGPDPTGTVSSPKCLPSGGVATRAVKQVTVVVRDLSKTPPRTLIRSTSTFDASTG